jgi:regulator of cell morphogenesis and NO signaling
MLDRNQTVAAVVLDHSECAAVFQRHHIDFCCKGDRSVAVAANERGLDPDALLAELAQAITGRRGDRATDPKTLTTPMLVAHIMTRHHEYLRTALPFITGLAVKVARVHGDHNPKLVALEAAVLELTETLLPHLDDEEQTLFPALLAKTTERAWAAKLLDGMLTEHLAVAGILERIRAASDEFSLPDWACNSYRTLFAELRQVESDIFTHVHLENHVLRPRFAA